MLVLASNRLNAEALSPSILPLVIPASICTVQETVALRGGGTTVAGFQVGHIAHLGGAFAGVLLVYALSRIPAKSQKKGSWS